MFPNYYFTFSMLMTLLFFLKGKELRELLVILNEELERINLWLQANKLTFNTQKSAFMIFHRARLKSFNSPILINGTQLQEVSSTKY